MKWCLIPPVLRIAKELANKYGYLEYMIHRYVKFLGVEETKALLEANERPLIPSIRINTIKISVKAMKNRLQEKDIKLSPVKWIPEGFRISHSPHNLGSLHEFLQGYFYLQQVASMIPPLILRPNKEDLVVDMCAAPGGKSTHLTQLMENKGRLILLEKDAERIAPLVVNLRRMGCSNALVLHRDATNMDFLEQPADKILLDAPCTGEGLIPEDPSRKTSKTQEDLKLMSSVQKRLLHSGLTALRPGAILAYSTCSIAPEENEFVIDEVLKRHPRCHVKNLPHEYGDPGLTSALGRDLHPDLKHSQRLYPHKHGTIGFFLCLLEKTP